MKEDESGGTSSMHVGEAKCVHILVGKHPMERNYLRDLGVDVNQYLKSILKI
jgi:hypothetical protein